MSTNQAKARSSQVPETPPVNWRRAIGLCLAQLDKARILKGSTVVLIGSYAHGSPSWRSDIDVLVLSQDDRRRVTPPRGIHLQFMEPQRFGERLRRGDDYALAATRFGKVLHDGLRIWQRFREQLKSAQWPDWREKYRYARRRIQLARWLLDAGDVDAASEEYLLAATQLGRAQLLRRNIFPLSRPELSGQLHAAGEVRLEAVIESLLKPTISPEEIAGVGEYLESITREE